MDVEKDNKGKVTIDIQLNEESSGKSDNNSHVEEITNKSKLSSIEELSFYTLISSPTDPDKAFNKLATDHKQQWEDKRKLQHDIYSLELDRIDSEVKVLNEEIKEKNDHLAKYKEDIQEYKTRIKKLDEEVEDLEDKIFEKHIQLGKNKSSMIRDRIIKTKEELDELIKTLDEVTRDKYKINKKNYDDNKDALIEEAKLFKTLSDYYEKSYENIEDKLLKLSERGITASTSKYFILSGVSTTTIAGWFFSAFSVKSGLNSDGWLFFILQSLLKSERFIVGGITLPGWITILVLIGGFIGLLILITLTFKVCDILLNKGKTDEREALQANEVQNLQFQGQIGNDNLHLKSSIKTHSPYKLWLSLLPYILIVGIVYLIIQTGVSGSDLTQLDKSLSGQVVGSALALMVGGLGFAYLTYIIIPRHEKTPIEHKESSLVSIASIRMNAEILILLIVFMIGLGFMYYYNDDGSGPLIGFVVSSLFSGFLLGIGLRYKGLLKARDEIEANLIYLQNQIKFRTRPFPMQMNDFQDYTFKKRYYQIYDKFLNLMNHRIIQIRGHFYEKPKDRYKSNTKSIANVILEFLNPRKKRKEPIVMPALTHSEESLFPEESTEIKYLQSRLETRQKELKHLMDLLDEIAEGRTNHQKEIKEEIKNLFEKIDNLKGKRIEKMTVNQSVVEIYRLQEDLEEKALYEGYDLAVWFLKYNNLKRVS
jgi:hypothetical protein